MGSVAAIRHNPNNIARLRTAGNRSFLKAIRRPILQISRLGVKADIVEIFTNFWEHQGPQLSQLQATNEENNERLFVSLQLAADRCRGVESGPPTKLNSSYGRKSVLLPGAQWVAGRSGRGFPSYNAQRWGPRG